MQFIADGPQIPLEVLRAQDAGRLVLFCGAGISVPAGLPSFAGLVDRVYAALTTQPNAIEKEELKKENYDRVLGLLEHRFGQPQLRQEVQKILATPPSPCLDTHQAILALATDREGQLRLVTTNFDLLFEVASPGVRATAAPLLPVPKPHKWNQLVYLHGKLDASDPEGKHLVLTSGDFGIAYLVERWASRFVGELFNHCTVLFVGYSVNDPVMRYLVDAIAAERTADDRLHRAYAFASFNPGGEAQIEAEWHAKGVVPILYDSSGHHAQMHDTLTAWARIWAGGLTSKLNIVTSLAPQDPAGLPQDAISQFCWALSEPSGASARELARLGKKANLAWLNVLDKEDLLLGPPHSSADLRVALVDRGQRTRHVPPLDPVRREIALWLTEHLDDPRLARWAVAAGGRLHPELMEFVRHKLRGSP